MEELKKPMNTKRLEKPTSVEELVNNISLIFTQFLQEELGNRVSQFGIKGLMDIIITEIMNYEPKEVRKDVKK